MAQASIDGLFVRRPHQPEEEPLPLVQRRHSGQPTNRWVQPSAYRSEALEPDDPMWAEFGPPERISTDDEYWDSIMAENDNSEWKRRRPRRIAVKALGWTSIIFALLAVFAIAANDDARSAMLQWGTLATAAPGVSE
jgi:hypothetical protein